MDIALLILRIVVGLYVAVHGAQKLFGWFGGPGLKATTAGMASRMGFRPAALWALAVAVAETGGGLLMALGLLGPIGPMAVASAMFTASIVAHWSQGPLATHGGYELPLTNLAVAVAVASIGAGQYSADALLGIAVPVWVSQAVAVLFFLGAVVAIVSRRMPAPQMQDRRA